MSFSIPVLKPFTFKVAGLATLNPPVISLSGDCGGCGYSVSGTITADVGNKIAYKITNYSDSSATVSCSDYTYLTVGNIAYLDNVGGTDHSSCVNRMPSGVRVLAVACNGSDFSNLADAYLTAIPCPTTIPAPTIVINSNSAGTVNFTVTSNYCDTTYIEFGPNFGVGGQGCPAYGSAPDPTTSSATYISGSGTIYNGSLTCTSNSHYSIKAKTYWNGVSSCSAMQSSITSSEGTIN